MTIEIIDKANHLANVPPEIKMALALPALFPKLNLKAIKIEDRYANGLSGSYIFKVRPIPIGRFGKMKPSVVKIGPFKLMEQEWKIYHEVVKDTLPEVPSLEDFAKSPDGKWGGLRYSLAGNDVEQVVSLFNYARGKVDIEDLRKILDRLCKVINTYWWGECEVVAGCKAWADYDKRLPVNLLLEYFPPFPGKICCIEPHLPLPHLEIGRLVQLKDFVIEEIDLTEKTLTLNLPHVSEDSLPRSYRVRVQGVPNIYEYQKYQEEKNPIPAIYGKIIDTRHAHLTKVVANTLQEAIGVSAEQFILSSGLVLPNPLFHYQKILTEPPDEVYISPIHDDLNSENILIYPDSGRFAIIDFATARHGLAIHDLLRLETDFVTKLVSQILHEANLPSETIYSFYQHLHKATFQIDSSSRGVLSHADLYKPFEVLITIRRAARGKYHNWREYYQGLILYLLGALKFKNLDEMPQAKEVAFLGAATLLDLLNNSSEVTRDEDGANLSERDVFFTPPCPYTDFSQPVQAETHAKWFFGREEFTNKLVEVVQQQTITAVVGPSGSGKSSVVFAGLLPRLLRKGDWLIAHFQPGEDPFHDLAEALLSLSETQTRGTFLWRKDVNDLAENLRTGNQSLRENVEQILQTKSGINRLLLVIDQFENLYKVCPELESPDSINQSRSLLDSLKNLMGFTVKPKDTNSGNGYQKFVDWLLEAVKFESNQQDALFSVILTLRADQLKFYEPLNIALQKMNVIQRLEAMTPTDLEKVIEGPAKAQGINFKEGLAKAILEDIENEPGGLMLLNEILISLWEQQKSGWLIHEAYNRIGGVAGVLIHRAEAIFTSFNQNEKRMVRRVFVQLVFPGDKDGDTPRWASQDDFVQDDWNLVQRLVKNRLVVIDWSPKQGNIVKLVHKALLQDWDKLRTWINDDRPFRIWQERVRRSYFYHWKKSHRTQDLLPYSELEEAKSWLIKRPHDLPSIERAYIQASIEHWQSEQVREEEERKQLVYTLGERDEQIRRREEVEQKFKEKKEEWQKKRNELEQRIGQSEQKINQLKEKLRDQIDKTEAWKRETEIWKEETQKWKKKYAEEQIYKWALVLITVVLFCLWLFF